MTMSAAQILIVDRQRKERQVLRASLEALGKALTVYDVPSGEEALLLLSRQPIDLLISEVRLAGMSGLELTRKSRQHRPQLKAILIAEPDQADLQAQATQAGAEALFHKPVDQTALIEAVRHSLFLAQGLPSQVDLSPGDVPEAKRLATGALSRWRADLKAIALLLLDAHGQVLARSGALPAAVEARLLPALARASHAAMEMAPALGKSTPQDLLYFSGVEWDVYLVHAAGSQTTMVSKQP